MMTTPPIKLTAGVEPAILAGLDGIRSPEFPTSALSGFDSRLSAQDESGRNNAETKNQGIEYPQREIVATRVAIIVQGDTLDPQDE
jgi:hypothetical protein